MKSMSMCCGKSWKSIGLLALRIALGVIFIRHGYMKLADITSTAGFFGMVGFPMPVFFAYFVGLAELISGIAVLLGIYTRLAAKVIAIIMIVAILTVHLKQDFGMMEFPLAILGGALALAGCGGGKWKVMHKNCVCGADNSGCCSTEGGCKDDSCGPEEKKM